jgi:hypothetical protein
VLLERRVHLDEPVVHGHVAVEDHVDDAEALVHGLEQGSVPCLTGSEGFLRLLPAGHIQELAREPDDAARGIPLRLPPGDDPAGILTGVAGSRARIRRAAAPDAHARMSAGSLMSTGRGSVVCIGER